MQTATLIAEKLRVRHKDKLSFSNLDSNWKDKWAMGDLIQPSFEHQDTVQARNNCKFSRTKDKLMGFAAMGSLWILSSFLVWQAFATCWNALALLCSHWSNVFDLSISVLVQHVEHDSFSHARQIKANIHGCSHVICLGGFLSGTATDSFAEKQMNGTFANLTFALCYFSFLWVTRILFSVLQLTCKKQFLSATKHARTV